VTEATTRGTAQKVAWLASDHPEERDCRSVFLNSSLCLGEFELVANLPQSGLGGFASDSTEEHRHSEPILLDRIAILTQGNDEQKTPPGRNHRKMRANVVTCSPPGTWPNA
jgi:hypothetical protein